MSYVKDAVLDIILPLSNPRRFKRREELFLKTLAHLSQFEGNFRLWPVEGAFNEREFVVNHPNAIRVRLRDELWQKENLINIALSRLPSDSKYVAWVDADIEFKNQKWISEAIEMLQHHPVIQPWSNCIHMGPDSQVLTQHKSFGYCNVQGVPRPSESKYGEFWHPGFAWAARMEVLQATGGLMDRAILGSGDHHMALAMIDRNVEGVPEGLSYTYYEYLKAWRDIVYPIVKGDVGYVNGTIMHHWHGRLVDRRYQERWAILQKHRYCPQLHVKHNLQGVLELTDSVTPSFKNDLRRYFIARAEDANTI